MDFSRVDAVVERAIRDGAAPGACYAVNNRIRAAGTLMYGGESVSEDTLWDLASLTKVVATTTLAMLLHEDGRLELDQQVRKALPTFRHDHITFRHLLLHNSGLPASHPCPSRIRESSELLRDFLSMDLAYAAGTATVYSDVGFIVLGKAIEAMSGESIETLFDTWVASPLGLSDTAFNPTAGQAIRCAPTEPVEPWRQRLRAERQMRPLDENWIRGEVHDPSATVLGGISGHAGLFSTIGDLVRLMAALRDGRIVRREIVELFTTRDSAASSRALGWDTPSDGSSAGSHLGPHAFGHTGFTGTSIWVDPDRDLTAILLTNRVHPTAQNEQIRAVRIAFHDAIAAT